MSQVAEQVYHDTPLFRGLLSILEAGFPQPQSPQSAPQPTQKQPQLNLPTRPTVLARPLPQHPFPPYRRMHAPPAAAPHRRMQAPPAAALRRVMPTSARGPGKGYRYCEWCSQLNHVRRSSCASCGRMKPVTPPGSRRPKKPGVRKRRRSPLNVRSRNMNIPQTPVPVDDPTPSLVSVHLGSGVLSELEAELETRVGSVNALVDCTNLAEVTSCAAALSDVTSESMRDSSFRDEFVREEETWDEPIGDGGFPGDLVDESAARMASYTGHGAYAGQNHHVALGAHPPQPNLDDILLCDFGISDKEILAPSEMPKSPQREVPDFPLSLLDSFLPFI